MFAYEPMTESQAMKERFQLLQDGTYDACIRKVSERQSSSGNWMFEVSLDIYHPEGGINSIRDYLVFTKGMMWKIIHCATSAGLLKEYEEGKLTSELLIDKNVKVVVKSQAGNLIPEDKLNGKPPGSKYPDKNVIEDYLKSETVTSSANDLFKDDDIPF